MDIKNTECPGKNFPFKEIKAKLNVTLKCILDKAKDSI